MSAAPQPSKPLIGTDEATIDDKGRLLVSKKKRERLGEPFALSLGSTGCLNAYPQAVWDAKWEEIQRHDSLNLGREQYTRLVLGEAEDELKFDAQGRVVIPQRLRQVAHLKDKVVVVGAGDHLEIWNAPAYEEFLSNPLGAVSPRRLMIDEAHKNMVGGS